MSKEKKYLAIKTDQGFPEAILIDFLEGNPFFKKDWVLRSKRAYPGSPIVEATEEMTKRETDRYGVFDKQEKERRKKELSKLKDDKYKIVKSFSDVDFVPLPPEETLQEDKLENKKTKKPSLKKNIIRRKK